MDLWFLQPQSLPQFRSLLLYYWGDYRELKDRTYSKFIFEYEYLRKYESKKPNSWDFRSGITQRGFIN